MAKATTHDLMLTWVSLVHAGTYLPTVLSSHLQEEAGISLAEQDLLSQLEKAGGRLKMVDLARIIYLSKAGVTKMVDRLEGDGLLDRVPSVTDGRVVYSRLTSKGKRRLAKSRKLLRAWVRANVGAHLADDQVLALGGALQRVLEGHGRWAGQMEHVRGVRGKE
jgi:DNA-binding MarR family transcriptional regulator